MKQETIHGVHVYSLATIQMQQMQFKDQCIGYICACNAAANKSTEVYSQHRV